MTSYETTPDILLIPAPQQHDLSWMNLDRQQFQLKPRALCRGRPRDVVTTPPIDVKQVAALLLERGRCG